MAHPFVDFFSLADLHKPLCAVCHWQLSLPVIVTNYSDLDLSAGIPHSQGSVGTTGGLPGFCKTPFSGVFADRFRFPIPDSRF